MMDDLAAIQSRIAEIQSKIDMLSSQLNPPAASTAGNSDPNANFSQVLAAQRARYGTMGQPEPTASVDTSVPLPAARTGIAVPPASMGPLPGTTGTPTGATPYVPTQADVVPIQSGGVSQYEPIIDRYAAANGLPPSLVKAIIKTESDGNPRSISRAGAMGLMQLMPDNVREAGIDDAFDPEQNIMAGTKQLAGFMSQYNGDLDLALAAYNAGPGNVRKYGGVPPFRETQDYIRKVRAAMGQE